MSDVCGDVGYKCIESVSRLLPKEFEEVYVRLYIKHNAYKDLAQRSFHRWCAAEGLGSGCSPSMADALLEDLEA